MPRTFALMTLAAAALLLAGPCAADTDRDRLSKILSDKYRSSPKSTSKETSPDLYSVDPEGKVRKLPSTPSTRSTGSKDKSSSSGTAPDTPVGIQPQPVVGHAMVATAISGSILRPSTDGHVVLAAETEMIVNRRIVVVQLKPATSEADIDALVKKHKLKVVDAVPSLGALYIAVDEPAANENASVSALLEPDIVVRLRQEPAVNAAFVQTTIGPRTLPLPTAASVKDGSEMLRWHWRTETSDDGNWGLKAIRLPTVWSIVGAKSFAGRQPPTTAVLDSGFGPHPQLTFQNLSADKLTRSGVADCGRNHGTHISGIIGAQSISGKGINGIVSGARIDAIPISRNLMLEGAREGVQRPQLQLSYFADVIRDLGEYFDTFPLGTDERRVVNISLAYNWAWVRKLVSVDPTTDQTVRNQIQQHANFIQYLVDRVSRQVLFVAAAGNDSEGLETPLSAKLASPFAFAALHETPYFTPSRNIIVVEAHDRRFRRASFSNAGGQVSAPGVAIMSTLSSDATPYGVCSGTSQAAPHVSAVASILLQLAPKRTPAEIANIIITTALPEAGGSVAPRLDALAAVLQLAPESLSIIADLDGDGKVDAQDIEVFKLNLLAIEGGRFGGRIEKDLNSDGVVDSDERCWPRIDLNGSGRASYDPADLRPILGTMRSDLDVLRMAWTDPIQSFDAALRRSGLSELIDVWRASSLVATSPGGQKGLPCL